MGRDGGPWWKQFGCGSHLLWHEIHLLSIQPEWTTCCKLKMAVDNWHCEASQQHSSNDDLLLKRLLIWTRIAHLSRPWSIDWLSSSIFPFCLSVPLWYYPTKSPLFFNIYRHKSLVLTQFYLIPSNIMLYRPSTTKYQPVPPHTDPVSSYIIFQYQTFLFDLRWTQLNFSLVLVRL